MSRAALLCAWLAAAAALVAQEPPAPAKRLGILQTRKDRDEPSLSTQVHEAWLKEALDLDVRGAMQAYDRIQKEAPRNQPLRWIATVRMAELQRLGVGQPEPLTPSLEQAPQAVREGLEQLREPLPVDELLAEPTAPIDLLALNPATALTQAWVRKQLGSTLDARWLQNMARYRRWADSQPAQYWWASDILRAELRGRPEQADALRKLWFADWQAPKLSGDPKELLAVVQQRLDAWIAEPEVSSRDRWRLRRLAEELQKRTDDPQAALEMVARLPTFAERLVGGEVPRPRAATDDPTRDGEAGGDESREQRGDGRRER